MEEIIKCTKCDRVLISGKGSITIFGKGTSIACKTCGEKYVFGEDKPKSDSGIKFVC